MQNSPDREDISHWRSRNEEFSCTRASSYELTRLICFPERVKMCQTVFLCSVGHLACGLKVCAGCCTCQDIKLKDGPFSSDEEEHRTVGALPERLVHKEPLGMWRAERRALMRHNSATALISDSGCQSWVFISWIAGLDKQEQHSVAF